MRLIIFISIIFFISCLNPAVLHKEEPFINMQRTGCYGTCPQYTVSIYNNGKIIYNGKLFVDKIGCFSSVISRKQVAAIKLFLHETDFFSFQNEYLSSMTDIPSVITEIYLEGKTHKVIDRLEGPKSLKECHKLIDAVTESIKNWSDCELLIKE